MKIRIVGENNFILKYCINNRIVFIFLMIIFALGICLGSVYYRDTTSTDELSKYIENLFEKFNEKTEAKTYNMLKESLINNIGIMLLFWILGASIVGVPILLFYIAYKGFTVSFTLSTIISTFGFLKGNLINFMMLFLSNFILINVFFVATASAIRLVINILQKKKEMKIELLRHTIMCMMCICGMLLTSAIEAFTNCKIMSFFLDRI